MVRSNKRRAAASEKKRVLEDTPHLFGPREATRNLDKVGVSRNSPFFIAPPPCRTNFTTVDGWEDWRLWGLGLVHFLGFFKFRFFVKSSLTQKPA